MIRRRSIIQLVLVACCFLNAAVANAIEVPADQASIQLSDKLKYLQEDADRPPMSLDAVLATDESRWTQLDHNPNFGATEKAYWFSARLSFTSDYRGNIEIDRPFMNDVDVYLLSDPETQAAETKQRSPQLIAKPIVRYQLGDRQPFSDRPVPHYNMIVPLDVKAGTTLRVLMRVSTDGMSLQFAANIWRDTDFQAHIVKQSTLYGLYFGALLLVAFYNIFVYISVRDPAYLLYVGYTLLMALASATGLGLSYQYLWPQSTTWNDLAVGVSTSAFRVFAFLFAIHFLQLPKRLPKAAMVLYAMIAIDVMFVLTSPFGSIEKLLSLYGLPSFIGYSTALLSGFILWHRGVKEARFYSIAWCAYVVVFILYALVSLGMFSYSPAYFSAFMLAQLAEAVLFALALADRLNIARENALELQKVSEQAALDAREHMAVRIQLMQTELERVEQEQKAQQEQLANRAKSEFLSNMSHEIRTPLNAILGFSELMLMEEEIPESQREYLLTINRSGEHLLNLINEVLDMSKIDAGYESLRPENVNLYKLLASMKSLFSERCRQRQLTMDVTHSANVPKAIYVDSGKLRQIIINLLSNAVKFTREGRITLRTDAELLADGQLRLIVEVEDTGVGISEDERANVFSSFKQTRSGIESGEGTGLGLAISREYARMMGGDLTYQSVLDKGSTFRLEVICEAASIEDDEVQDTLHKPVGLQADEPHYRILIVDDKASNRRLLQQILSPIGFELKQASNGAEAIELFEQWQPDLILMDNRMPVMNGSEATQKIRTSKEGKTIPIIAVTANAFEQDREKIIAQGASDFIRKPFKDTEVLSKIRSHLDITYVYREISAKDN